jgi:hypothetical protein
MADSKTSTDPQTPPAPEGTDEAENKFWEKFDLKIGEAIDRKVEEFRQTGTSRTGGRTSLPSIIAEAFLGKPKS